MHEASSSPLRPSKAFARKECTTIGNLLIHKAQIRRVARAKRYWTSMLLTCHTDRPK